MTRQALIAPLVVMLTCLATIWSASQIAIAACANTTPYKSGCTVGPTSNCTRSVDGKSCSGSQVERQDGNFSCKGGTGTECLDGGTETETHCTITYACKVQPNTANPVICIGDKDTITTSSDQIQKVNNPCGT